MTIVAWALNMSFIPVSFNTTPQDTGCNHLIEQMKKLRYKEVEGMPGSHGLEPSGLGLRTKVATFF